MQKLTTPSEARKDQANKFHLHHAPQVYKYVHTSLYVVKIFKYLRILTSSNLLVFKTSRFYNTPTSLPSPKQFYRN